MTAEWDDMSLAGMLFGIDCASHQGYPDWMQLRDEGHDFMITKVNGEHNYVNPYWRDNHDRARAAGMVPGTYDWVEPQNAAWQSGEDAAADYLRTIGTRRLGSLLTVDFESPEWHTGILGGHIEAWMQEYLYTLKERSGQPVIVYTAPYFLRETGAIDWEWLGQDFIYWMAAPGGATGTHDMMADNAPWPGPITEPWDIVTIHQHQWFARSSAVVGHFDRNRFRGSRAQLEALAGIERSGIVQEPEEGKYTAYINTKGQPIFVWNMGGETPQILGIDIKDMGMTVQSATEPDKQISASIQNNAVGLHHESKKPAV